MTLKEFEKLFVHYSSKTGTYCLKQDSDLIEILWETFYKDSNAPLGVIFRFGEDDDYNISDIGWQACYDYTEANGYKRSNIFIPSNEIKSMRSDTINDILK
jgi:hypothetical protein